MTIKNFNTNELSSREQFAFWNDAVCDVFTALECQRPDRKTPSSQAYRGSLESWDLGELQVTRVVADPSRVDHSLHQVAKSTQDVQLLHLQLAGTSSNIQCGREAVLQPGDFTICDSTQPYLLTFNQPIDMMVLRIPNLIFEKHFQNDNQIFGQRFSSLDAHGLSGVVSDYIQNIWQYRSRGHSDQQLQSMADCALSLLASNIDSYGGLGAVSEESSAKGLLHGMKVYINKNIADPVLSPESVAAAIHISPRYLRSLFASESLTCSRYIAQQRLSMAALMLRDMQCQHLKIIDVAFRCGFQDASHFSRRFSEHFGRSPKVYRQEH